MERWLLTKDCMPPEEFVAKNRTFIEQIAASIGRPDARMESHIKDVLNL